MQALFCIFLSLTHMVFHAVKNVVVQIGAVRMAHGPTSFRRSYCVFYAPA